MQGLRACILLAAARQLPLATSWFVGLLKALAMEQRHRLERGKLMVVRNYDLHACRGVLTEMRVLGVPPDAHIFGMLAAVHVAYNDLPRAEVRHPPPRPPPPFDCLLAADRRTAW